MKTKAPPFDKGRGQREGMSIWLAAGRLFKWVIAKDPTDKQLPTIRLENNHFRLCITTKKSGLLQDPT